MAKFQVQGNDEIILVEFESESGLQNVSYGPSQFLEKSIEDSRKAIDRAMDTMRGMAKRTMASIKDIPLAERPTTISVSFGLKLDADWVVLSACNTAAGDSRDADALSGLVRGFFYAGSRALLVTHWPVETVSARLLVTEIFQRQAADARLSGAEALRQSMLALMGKQSAPTGGYSYSHPIFWAPYALVGDGGS